MKTKLIFTDGTVLIFDEQGTKKSLLNRYKIGQGELVLNDRKIIDNIEFPTLRLTRREIIDLSTKIHDLGNYFSDFEDWKNQVENELETYELSIGNEIENGLFSIVDSEGDEIENFILKVATHDMKNGIEVVSYNTCF